MEAGCTSGESSVSETVANGIWRGDCRYRESPSVKGQLDSSAGKDIYRPPKLDNLRSIPETFMVEGKIQFQ